MKSYKKFITISKRRRFFYTNKYEETERYIYATKRVKIWFLFLWDTERRKTFFIDLDLRLPTPIRDPVFLGKFLLYFIILDFLASIIMHLWSIIIVIGGINYYLADITGVIDEECLFVYEYLTNFYIVYSLLVKWHQFLKGMYLCIYQFNIFLNYSIIILGYIIKFILLIITYIVINIVSYF
jgi:hypothetical protein